MPKGAHGHKPEAIAQWIERPPEAVFENNRPIHVEERIEEKCRGMNGHHWMAEVLIPSAGAEDRDEDTSVT